MKFFRKILFLIIYFIISGCVSNNKIDNKIAEELSGIETPFFIDIAAEEAKEIINYNDDMVIIDISENFSKGHLPNAINVSFSNIEKEIQKLDKNKTYLIYGDIESYSQAIASRLAENNFPNVYRLEGGIGSWTQAGYEVKD